MLVLRGEFAPYASLRGSSTGVVRQVAGLTFLPLALFGFFLYACYVDLLSLNHSS